MSNQLISGEYFYKGRIKHFLVKCHIYQGNKQIYNNIFRSSKNIFCCSLTFRAARDCWGYRSLVCSSRCWTWRCLAPGGWRTSAAGAAAASGYLGRRLHIVLFQVYNVNIRYVVKFSDFDISIFTVWQAEIMKTTCQ